MKTKLSYLTDLGTADSRGVDQREGEAMEGEGDGGRGEGVLDGVVGQHVAPAVQEAPGWGNNFIFSFAERQGSELIILS